MWNEDYIEQGRTRMDTRRGRRRTRKDTRIVHMRIEEGMGEEGDKEEF